MTRKLAEQITADTPEFERLVGELERAWAEFNANKCDATAERAGDAVVALGEHCGKMNAYLKPALEVLQTMYPPPRRKRGKARR